MKQAAVANTTPAAPRLFLCHSSRDKEVVERIAHRLRTAGLDVWYDAWEIHVGDSIADKIDKGITASDFLVIVLSRHSVKSAWVRKELDAALAREVKRRGAFVLPVLIDRCQVPPLLQGKRYANFMEGPDAAIAELVEAVLASSVFYRTLRLSKQVVGQGRDPSDRLAVTPQTVTLYTGVTGSDHTMYEGEAERGLDEVQKRCESVIGRICAHLLSQDYCAPGAFSREVGNFLEKVGFPGGSISSSIFRSQDDWLTWESEVAVQFLYQTNPDLAAKALQGLLSNEKLRWNGARYSVAARLRTKDAPALLQKKGLRCIEFLPEPSAHISLFAPIFAVPQYSWSKDKQTPVVDLHQVSNSVLSIDIHFSEDLSCWPGNDRWKTFGPESTLREFLDIMDFEGPALSH